MRQTGLSGRCVFKPAAAKARLNRMFILKLNKDAFFKKKSVQGTRMKDTTQ